MMNIQITQDGRGVLGVVEFENIPFAPQRLFWMSGIPNGETRGHHAHKSCEQFIFVIAGEVITSVDFVDGNSSIQKLSTGDSLHLGIQQWLVLSGFSSDCVLAVLASEPYQEEEYIRSREEFDSLSS